MNKTLAQSIALTLIFSLALGAAGCSKQDDNEKSSKKKTKETEAREILISVETEAPTTQPVATDETTVQTTPAEERIVFGMDSKNAIQEEVWKDYIVSNLEHVELDNELINADFVYADIIDGEVYAAIETKHYFDSSQIYPGAQVEIYEGFTLTVGEEFSVSYEGYNSRQISGYGTSNFAPTGSVVTTNDINDQYWFEFDEKAQAWYAVGYTSDDDVGFFSFNHRPYYAVLPVATNCEIYYEGAYLGIYDADAGEYNYPPLVDALGNDSTLVPDAYGLMKFVPTYDDYSACRQFAFYIDDMDYELVYIMDFDYEMESAVAPATEFTYDVFNHVISCFMYVENGTVTKIYFYFLPCGAPSYGGAAKIFGGKGNGTYYCEPQ